MFVELGNLPLIPIIAIGSFAVVGVCDVLLEINVSSRMISAFVTELIADRRLFVALDGPKGRIDHLAGSDDATTEVQPSHSFSQFIGFSRIS